MDSDLILKVVLLLSGLGASGLAYTLARSLLNVLTASRDVNTAITEALADKKVTKAEMAIILDKVEALTKDLETVGHDAHRLVKYFLNRG